MTRRGILALLAPQSAVTGVLRQRRDVFTSPAPVYTLSAQQTGVVLVHLNGLLMAEGPDYWLNGRSLIFSSMQPASQQSPMIIQVHYWSL